MDEKNKERLAAEKRVRDLEKRLARFCRSARKEPKAATPLANACPFCGGAGQVSGTIDDMAFTFQCVCVGGDEKAVRWLLG